MIEKSMDVSLKPPIDQKFVTDHEQSVTDTKPYIEVISDRFSPQTPLPSTAVKYQQLPRIDKAHAESLARSCGLRKDASHGSRRLAGSDLVQKLLTSIPLLAADFASLWALLLCVSAAIERLSGMPHDVVTRDTALVAALLLVPIARLAGLYPALGTSAAVEFRQLVQSAATALCIFAGIGSVAQPSRWPFFVFASLLTMLLAVPILPAARYVTRCFAAQFTWWGAPALIHAPAKIAIELYDRLHLLKERGLRPAGVLLSSEDYWLMGSQLEDRGIPTYDVRNGLECALKHHATWVLIANGGNDGDEPWGHSTESENELNAIPNRVLISSGGFDCGMWDQTHTIGPICGLWLSNSRHCRSQALLKRSVDVIVTSIALLLASPLLLAIAVAIRLSSPGPIFYSQSRIGRGGEPFSAWKFRSMLPDADQVLQHYLDNDLALRREWEETHKLKKDPRVTWIGKLLRTTSFDELPQLWNILVGDMSLVGPRPIVNSSTFDAKYINDYPKEYHAYISVRPGLTGLWQVTCRNSGVYEMRIYWDMYYIRNWSLWLDLYIILRTIRTVILREGAA